MGLIGRLRSNERLFTHKEISRTFDRAIVALGFNDGIDDPRQKVCFHSLRHTFASWHAKAGTPLFTISKLLGHKDIKMTMRYAHLCPTAERQAVKALQGALLPQEPATVLEFKRRIKAE